LKRYIKFLSKLFGILLIIIFGALSLNAQETPIKNAYHYTLDNGLELFVMENHSVPLTYIEIAVRAGGITQTKENAGLFHLYEHMMFKGNAQYPTAADVQKALNDLGVSNWNGSTAAEHVNYFFTVPSDLTEKGLKFWSSAMRTPLLDPAEMENEKKVVISEISGSYTDPNTIYSMATQKVLFPKYPWRLDPAGPVENVKNATIEQLHKIQQTYYIPNNAALFVGGDVNHTEVYKMVKNIYGDWKKGFDTGSEQRDLQLAIPFEKSQYLVMPHPQISPQVAQVTVTFRGPDTAIDTENTYAADVFTNLSQNPTGLIKKSFMAVPELAIPSPEYISAGYYTQREGGEIYFQTLMLKPEQSIAQRAQLFQNVVQTKIINGIIEDPNYFKATEYQNVKQRLKDSDLYNTETASGFLSNLRFWWTVASTEYYFGYNDRMSAVTSTDITNFATKYLKEKPALVTVLVNPAVYEAQKDEFEAAGFTTITADNAFWWKDIVNEDTIIDLPKNSVEGANND
jgi:zinc protease